MVFFESPVITIHWIGDAETVWMEWKGTAKGEDFRTALDKGLELVKSRRTSRWLADMRNMGPVEIDDQKWSNEDWFPRAIASGIRRIAMLAPRKVVAKMSVKIIMTKVNDADMETAYFDTFESAKAWLVSAK